MVPVARFEQNEMVEDEEMRWRVTERHEEEAVMFCVWSSMFQVVWEVLRDVVKILNVLFSKRRGETLFTCLQNEL